MPFEGPINLDQEAAALARIRDAKLKCVCPDSPWCQGQASADWLACDSRCKACKPPPWQPPSTPRLTEAMKASSEQKR